MRSPPMITRHPAMVSLVRSCLVVAICSGIANVCFAAPFSIQIDETLKPLQSIIAAELPQYCELQPQFFIEQQDIPPENLAASLRLSWRADGYYEDDTLLATAPLALWRPQSATSVTLADLDPTAPLAIADPRKDAYGQASQSYLVENHTWPWPVELISLQPSQRIFDVLRQNGASQGFVPVPLLMEAGIDRNQWAVMPPSKLRPVAVIDHFYLDDPEQEACWLHLLDSSMVVNALEKLGYELPQ